MKGLPPYLAVLIILTGLGFGAFFSSHHTAAPVVQCMVPLTFNPGQHLWAPGTPGEVPAWSVTPVKGWAQWTCGDNNNWVKSGEQQ